MEFTISEPRSRSLNIETSPEAPALAVYLEQEVGMRRSRAQQVREWLDTALDDPQLAGQLRVNEGYVLSIADGLVKFNGLYEGMREGTYALQDVKDGVQALERWLTARDSE